MSTTNSKKFRTIRANIKKSLVMDYNEKDFDIEIAAKLYPNENFNEDELREAARGYRMW
jgi:hypothetical protein